MKRFICFLLLLATLVLVFAACGKKGGGGGGTTTPAGTTTPGTTTPGATTTTDIWVDSIGPEVRALAEEQRSLKFEMSRLVNSELTAKTDIYMGNGEEMGASYIEQLVWERNKTAEELLGVTMTYTYNPEGWNKISSTIEIGYNGKEAPDMYVNMVYDLVFSSLSGYFRDVKSMDGYFDFEADGWLNEYMSDLSIGQDRYYLLASYYFLDLFRAMFVIPFNVDMMDANVDRLKDIITQEELAGSEKLSTYFFELVQEGKWTYDVLTAICEAVWQDTGTTENADDFSDILGFVADSSSGYASSGILYSNEVNITEEVKDENGMVTAITYPAAPSETLITIYNEVAELFTANGTHVTNGGAKDTSMSKPGINMAKRKFAEGTLLFGGAVVLGQIADTEYQEMQQQFSVVPLPVLRPMEEGGELPYVTIFHTRGSVGAINVMSTKYKVVSAFVQYVSENSEPIYDEYLNVTIKFDDFSGNAGTSAMLDIIYDSIRSNREKTIDDVIHKHGWNDINSYKWNGLMQQSKFTKYGNGNIVSDYEAAYKAKQGHLSAVLSEWAASASGPVTKP